MYENYDYLIVGAGLYGATFARLAKDDGKNVLVIDKRPHVAGNAYTEEVEGIMVHKYGAHIFHTSDDAVWQFVNRFGEFNRFTNSPIAKYDGEVYNLPFNMNTFSRIFGLSSPAAVKMQIEKEKAELGGKTPENLEEQAISLVGRTIYEILVKGYTEKQWGRPCTALPPSIIKRLPLRFTYDNNYFDDKHQGIPVDGYTKLVERMLDGIDVKLSTPYDPTFSGAKRIVWTGPIDQYYAFCYGHLQYRSLEFNELVYDEGNGDSNVMGNAVTNYTGLQTEFTRAIEHKHFAFGHQAKTVVTYERSKEWIPGDEPYYPIDNVINRELYSKYRVLADNEPKVRFAGRLGTYSYLNMDQVIKNAMNDYASVLFDKPF